MVRNRSKSELKLIPYIGCKAGFSGVFDQIIPPNAQKPVLDVFGGGGSFSFYSCKRFGGENVIYNDNNPVLVNLMNWLKAEPVELWRLYQDHYSLSSTEHYSTIREQPLDCGLEAAGRFLYLAKNAFSGKIRFNRSNQFNTPMRKGSQCPKLDLDNLQMLSDLIQDMTICNKDY